MLFCKYKVAEKRYISKAYLLSKMTHEILSHFASKNYFTLAQLISLVILSNVISGKSEFPGKTHEANRRKSVKSDKR